MSKNVKQNNKSVRTHKSNLIVTEKPNKSSKKSSKFSFLRILLNNFLRKTLKPNIRSEKYQKAVSRFSTRHHLSFNFMLFLI